jgi:catechol 2,3-dioxygenase-like lactoylglutathione lyase family enzyme
VDGKPNKAKAVGIIHVALEVGNIAEALSFYGNFLNFQIERMSETAAFIYFGYQFLNFAKVRDQIPDEQRHFGIAVDDKNLARIRLGGMGIEILGGRFLDFLDPWGNGVKITTYIQQHSIHQSRSRAQRHGPQPPQKNDDALAELKKKKYRLKATTYSAYIARRRRIGRR